MITCFAAVQNCMLSRFPLPLDEEILIGGPRILVSSECLDPEGRFWPSQNTGLETTFKKNILSFKPKVKEHTIYN